MACVRLEPTSGVELREAFARRTDTSADDWFLVFKARYGMREVFRALRDGRGEGAVTTTLFTGCTAVDAIMSAGLAPAYAAIDPATLGIDVRLLPATLHVPTRAVLLQHSYGIIDELATAHAAGLAHEVGALLVEDSAHCVARLARGVNGAPLADVSIHSFGIEKTFSNLYFGGAIWVNPEMADALVHDRIVSSLSSLPPLPERLDVATQRYRTHARILSRLPGPLARALRTRLLRRGSFEPPVVDVERRGGLPYDSYQPSEWIVRQILPMLATLDADEANRRACVARYLELLGGVGGLRIPAAVTERAASQPLIRMPVILPSRDAAVRVRAALASNGLYAVDWYHVPFYPGAPDPIAYGVSTGAVATHVSAYGGSLGLPTDIAPERVADAVSALCLQPD